MLGVCLEDSPGAGQAETRYVLGGLAKVRWPEGGCGLSLRRVFSGLTWDPQGWEEADSDGLCMFLWRASPISEPSSELC